MTLRYQVILTGALFCAFLAWFLPLRYGRSPETKERHRQQFRTWLSGSSVSARVFKIAVALLTLATIAHVFLTLKEMK